MIRIAICDDEKYMSDHIRAMVSDFFHKKNREVTDRYPVSGYSNERDRRHGNGKETENG